MQNPILNLSKTLINYLKKKLDPTNVYLIKAENDYITPYAILKNIEYSKNNSLSNLQQINFEIEVCAAENEYKTFTEMSNSTINAIQNTELIDELTKIGLYSNNFSVNKYFYQYKGRDAMLACTISVSTYVDYSA